MKRIRWIIISCLCVALAAAYGVMGFTDSTVIAETSRETKGSFVRIEDGAKKLVITADGKESVYPLSATAWVYRNMQKSTLAELQPGDLLELILNSKEQAAYIKAFSPQTAGGQPEGTAPVEAANQAAAGAPPSTGTAPVPSGETAAGQPSADGAAGAGAEASQRPGGQLPPAQAGSGTGANGKTTADIAASVHPGAAASQSGAAAGSIEKLSMEWKSRDLMLRMKLAPSTQGKDSSELYMQTKDQAIVHLTGASAEAFIQMMLKGLPTERQSFEQALKQKIAGEFQLKEMKPEWKLDVKWGEAAAAPSSSKIKGYEKEKHSDNSKRKEKDEDKDKNKEKYKDVEKDKYKEKDYEKGNDRGKESKSDRGDRD